MLLKKIVTLTFSIPGEEELLDTFVANQKDIDEWDAHTGSGFVSYTYSSVKCANKIEYKEDVG